MESGNGRNGFFIKIIKIYGGMNMKHKVKVTVIDKKWYLELQQEYCANPESGPCPCYNVGDEAGDF